MSHARLSDALVSACPAPKHASLVLVFGGSFDPVTLAHTTLAECAAREAHADWTLFVPAKRNPLKPEGPRASDADRVEMLRLALGGHDRVGVCTLEIEREGASYTIDTVRELQTRLGPSVTLRLLIGADQALSFHRWKEPEALLEEAEPVVALRPPIGTCAELEARLIERWGGDGAKAWAARVVDAPLLDVAATEAREVIEREGVSGARARNLISPDVGSYIADKGLYSGRA